MASPRVAYRYAKSLISLAQEQNAVEAIKQDLSLLAGTLRSSDDLSLMLTSPIVMGDKKLAVLDAIFASKVSTLTMAFIRILVEKGRESILAGVASAGLALIRDLNNVRVVEVTTAAGLDDSTRERVLAEIKKLHGGEIELSERVDEDIIGGYTLKMDDLMIDASTRRQLQLLRRELTEHDYEPEF